jgi:hypothetical protein
VGVDDGRSAPAGVMPPRQYPIPKASLNAHMIWHVAGCIVRTHADAPPLLNPKSRISHAAARALPSRSPPVAAAAGEERCGGRGGGRDGEEVVHGGEQGRPARIEGEVVHVQPVRAEGGGVAAAVRPRHATADTPSSAVRKAALKRRTVVARPRAHRPTAGAGSGAGVGKRRSLPGSRAWKSPLYARA